MAYTQADFVSVATIVSRLPLMRGWSHEGEHKKDPAKSKGLPAPRQPLNRILLATPTGDYFH
jgi:hypothetical protein